MLKWLMLLMIVIIILAVMELIREIKTFQVTRYEIDSPKLKGTKKRKIVFLSDLHNYKYGKNNEKLIEAIKAEKPDLILVAGDMLVGKPGVSADVAIQFMKELPKIAPTFCANGNHEQRMKECPDYYGDTYFQYQDVIVKNGVRLLENEKTELLWENCEVEIWGLEIPALGYKKFQKITMPDNFMEQNLGVPDKLKYQILIAHNPIYTSEYLKWGADLVVSGHLHGGIARIPGWRGVITPQGGFFPKYSGELTKEGQASVVVSKGLGVHTIPIRFMNPAEMIVLHIGGMEE